MEKFDINIEGFDAGKVKNSLRLKPGSFFSSREMESDLDKIRQELLKEDFIAPQLEDLNPVFDPEKNEVSLELKGNVGPKVVVNIEAGKEKISERKQQELLAIKREGTLEQSAIVEGERRLLSYFQEHGYFFADVTSNCSVTPEFPDDPANPLKNGTADLCAALVGSDLENKEVDVNYEVELSRRLKLVDIRIVGTDKLSYRKFHYFRLSTS